MSNNKVQQRLIRATADLILEEGAETLTHRKIAQRAQTNTASINYYFRSQNQLVLKGLLTAVNHLVEDLENATRKNIRYGQNYIDAVLNTFADYRLPYKNLVVSIYFLNNISDETTAPARNYLQDFCNKLTQSILLHHPKQSVLREQIRFKLWMLPLHLYVNDRHLNHGEILEQLFPELNDQ